MTCSVSIPYPYQMNFFEFHKVAIGMSYQGARLLVHNIMSEKEPHDEDCADPDLYYKFDNKIAIREDIYEPVKIAPVVRKLIMTALVDKLKAIFEEKIVDYVYPFSQAEGIPGDVVNNTPVKLRATNDDEWLTFVFSADLNLVNDYQPVWRNVKVDITYIQLPEEKDG